MKLRIDKFKKTIACLCAIAMLVVMPMPVMADGYDGGSISDGTTTADLEKNASGNGWQFDESTRTLTLNGFTGNHINWYEAGVLTIVLHGNNTLTADGSEYNENNFVMDIGNMEGQKTGVLIKGDGTLNVNGIIYSDFHNTTFTMESGTLICKPMKSLIPSNLSMEAIGCGTVEMKGGLIDLTIVDGTGGISCNNFTMTGGTVSGREALTKENVFVTMISAHEKLLITNGLVSLNNGSINAANLKLGNWVVAESGFVKSGEWDSAWGNPLVLRGSSVETTPTPAPSAPTYTSKTGENLDQWAQEGVNKAIDAGLMPECLKNTDLTKNITRAQFAALAVTLYEKMGGEAVSLDGVTNPFADTQDSMVLKAYALGIANGTGTNIFSPDKDLTREEAATMLLRAYEKLGDNVKEYNFEPFADDAMIVDWAKKAVYFMADKGIVNGVGNNNFNPKGSAQSQQTLIIALRMLDNLKING